MWKLVFGLTVAMLMELQCYRFQSIKFYIQENCRYLHSFCLFILKPQVWQRNLKIPKK